MKVNLKMLSESLGLSQTTVSRALNGYTDVAEATRRRVKEAAAAMGYQPDPLARRLATGRTDTIGMVFPFNATEFGDHRFGEVVAGLTEGLAKHNMDLSIIPTRPESELETYARMIDSRRVDAFIVGWTGGRAIVTPYDDCVLVMPTLVHATPGATLVRFARAQDTVPTD